MRIVVFIAAAAMVAGCSGNHHPVEHLWYVNGHVTGLGMRGKIQQVEHQRTTPAEALDDLLNGPTQSERAQGLTTAIPEGTRVARISVSNLTASVRLASSTQRREWRSGVYASAQIVYTLTEFDEIARVKLSVNGEQCCLYDMRHRPIKRLLTRRVFRGWQGDPLPPPG